MTRLLSPPPPTRAPAARPARRPAFTLVEILVVVFLLGVLTTLLVIGIKHLSENARRQQTRATLAQAQSMYAAWQTVGRQPFAPTVVPAPGDVTVDFAQAKPLVDHRYGGGVWFTRDVISLSRSVPTNAAALSKLPGSALMTIPGTDPAFMPFAPTEWTPAIAATTDYTPFAGASYGRVYIKSDENPTTYVYYQAIQFVPRGSPSPAVDRAHWILAYPLTLIDATKYSDTSVPVMLDAWGNPVVFVSGGTFGSGAALNADGTVVPGSGAMRAGTGTSALTFQQKSPDGRPFFVSAGPDGNFATADDNLYSFEK